VNRALVTGGHGLLGKEITETFRRGCEVRAIDIHECDVTDRAACLREIGGFQPQVVIHCAAYTAVDRAETEWKQAHAVNAEGTRNVAAACREFGALLVTFGTDYVFDGTLPRPYREDDPVNPLSVYAKSKLAAEEAVRAAGCDYLLVRTQWLYGPGGKNFILTVLDKARKGENLRVAADQTGCPTYTKDLVDATLLLLQKGARGTVHFSNGGETSWFGLAGFVLERAGIDGAQLLPAATRDLPYPAPRPAYSVLSKERFRKITGTSPRSWEQAAGEFLESVSGERSRR
jgi:dTDP-4-dehydrorhamnose reductase